MYDAPSEPSDNDNVIPTTTSSYIQLVCYPRSGKTAIQVFHNTGAIDSEMCGSEAIHLAGHAAHSDRSICPWSGLCSRCELAPLVLEGSRLYRLQAKAHKGIVMERRRVTR